MKSFVDIANAWVNEIPVYEAGRPIEEVARELGIENAGDIVNVASNENALGPSPLALQAMQKSDREMHRYPDGGAYYLKQALAQKLGVEPDCILPGNGSNELIELLGHVFLGPGTGIVMADCAFLVYRLVAASSRAGISAVPMKEFTHDLDAMLAAITPATRIVFVSNPNNPTGTMVDGASIDRFMENAPDHVVICFDEAYIGLLPEEKQPDTLKYVRAGRHVVVLRTFSKVHGLAGLRIGYAVAPRECIGLLNRVRQPFNVNAMAQAAARAALDDDEHVEKTRLMVREGLDYLERELKRIGLSFVPAVTNFMLVDVGKGREVFEAMQKEGVIARPMDGYGLPGYVRITVGTREDNERCVLALEKAMT